MTKLPLLYSVRLRNKKQYARLNTKILNGVDDILAEPSKKQRDAWIRTITKGSRHAGKKV